MTAPETAPRPKRRALRTVLIIVGALAVLCCGLGIFFSVKGLSIANGPVRSAANAYLTDLEKGDTTSAYQSLCPAVRAETTQADFDAIIAGRPTIRGHSITGSSITTTNGDVAGSVDATLTYADGTSQAHSIPLVSDGGVWRVCGNPD